jgi:hypothetical protein
MNSYTHHTTPLHHQRGGLETLVRQPDYTTAYHPARLGNLLAAVGQRLTNWLTTGSMPHISKKVRGTTEVWRVYDPVADRTLYFDQEEPLRAWMETRYYQA